MMSPTRLTLQVQGGVSKRGIGQTYQLFLELRLWLMKQGNDVKGRQPGLGRLKGTGHWLEQLTRPSHLECTQR